MPGTMKGIFSFYQYMYRNLEPGSLKWAGKGISGISRLVAVVCGSARVFHEQICRFLVVLVNLELNKLFSISRKLYLRLFRHSRLFASSCETQKRRSCCTLRERFLQQ